MKHTKITRAEITRGTLNEFLEKTEDIDQRPLDAKYRLEKLKKTLIEYRDKDQEPTKEEFAELCDEYEYVAIQYNMNEDDVIENIDYLKSLTGYDFKL